MTCTLQLMNDMKPAPRITTLYTTARAGRRDGSSRQQPAARAVSDAEPSISSGGGGRQARVRESESRRTADQHFQRDEAARHQRDGTDFTETCTRTQTQARA